MLIPDTGWFSDPELVPGVGWTLPELSFVYDLVSNVHGQDLKA